MWLVAVVGRCVVGCEPCEGYCSTMHGHRNLERENTVIPSNGILYNLYSLSNIVII